MAARLKQLGLEALIIDQNPRIGDRLAIQVLSISIARLGLVRFDDAFEFFSQPTYNTGRIICHTLLSL